MVEATTLGRYTLLRPIAQGGMAEVFLAERRSQGGVARFVALKRLLPHLSKQSGFVAMFLDEARLAARLTHQNIVQIVDFGVIEDQFFLAMEYLTGESVSAVLRKVAQLGEQVPPGIAFSVASQVCDGLHFAHTFSNQGVPLQVVHRDISPTNVLLTFQGGVKVIDFGIASATDRLQDSTGEGTFKGKVAYSSPEQLSGQRLDARSDVFSVGILLHEMLSGQRLFRRDSELATFTAVTHEPAPPLRALRPDLPEGIDEVLGRALAKDRDQRYPTAMALRRDLDALMPTSPPRIDDWLEHLYGREHITRAMDLERQRQAFPSKPPPRPSSPTEQATSPASPPVLAPRSGSRRAVVGFVVALGVALALLGWWWAREPAALATTTPPPPPPTATPEARPPPPEPLAAEPAPPPPSETPPADLVPQEPAPTAAPALESPPSPPEPTLSPETPAPTKAPKPAAKKKPPRKPKAEPEPENPLTL